MAKIVEILETERKRPTAADFDVVHMYKTGQFYTAYDWSAWIISVISYTDAVRMQTKDRHPLAVTRIKIATSEQTFCKVGFPFKSIEKFCPKPPRLRRRRERPHHLPHTIATTTGRHRDNIRPVE